MAQMREHSQSKHELAVGDKSETEEGGTTKGTLGVVQEAVNASVREASRNLLDEEKVRVEPAKVAKDLVCGNGRPNVEGNEKLKVSTRCTC